jgi:hypothetical protein
MSIDAVAISAIIIAGVGAFGAFVKTSHLQKCKACCVESDCRQSKKGRTPPETPITSEPAVIEINQTYVSEI